MGLFVVIPLRADGTTWNHARDRMLVDELGWFSRCIQHKGERIESLYLASQLDTIG